jgi:hypothetical protein
MCHHSWLLTFYMEEAPNHKCNDSTLPDPVLPESPGFTHCLLFIIMLQSMPVTQEREQSTLHSFSLDFSVRLVRETASHYREGGRDQGLVQLSHKCPLFRPPDSTHSIPVS